MKRNFLKKIFSGLLLFILCLTYVPHAHAQLYSEEITLKINYLWIFQLGKFVLKREPYVLNEEDIYQISAHYEPSGWLSLFYRWKGRFFSYIDRKGLLPLRYEEFISYPFHDDVNSVLIYDQDKKRVFIDRNGEKETKAIWDHTLDPLSALNFVRYYPWNGGVSEIFHLNSHQQNYELIIRCQDKTVYDDREVWILEGRFRRKDQPKKFTDLEFRTYLSTSDSRLPLKIVLYTQYGPVSLRLN